MHVLMLSPGYPAEMPHFTRALAETGARVHGLGDQPAAALPDVVRNALASYVQVPSLWDEPAVVEQVKRLPGAGKVERIEAMWEPCMMLAARLREALGIAGANLETTLRFRDKELMKQALDRAGLRTPRHVRASTVAECWQAAEALGFPLILKPIAGAGSADTYRVDSADDLRAVLPRLLHVPEVSVEEFIDGEEYTFDAITVNGHIAYYNVAWYRPRPLIARTNEWISPQVIALRHVDQPHLADGVALGRAVIDALDVGTAFTHMEWYRKSDGEVVFGEIGLRPPGAHQVDQMNYACDIDAYALWANAVVGSSDNPALWAKIARKYNVATVYKRAIGQGRIRDIAGWQRMRARYGAYMVWNTLLPVGAQRRNWRSTLVSDGFIMLRHPHLDKTLAMADDIAENLRLYAG